METLRDIETSRLLQFYDHRTLNVYTLSAFCLLLILFCVAGKSLKEMRQLYFKMKDQVFSNDRFGFGYNTEVLEKLLIEEFGTELRMSDVTFPRYMLYVCYHATH